MPTHKLVPLATHRVYRLERPQRRRSSLLRLVRRFWRHRAHWERRQSGRVGSGELRGEHARVGKAARWRLATWYAQTAPADWLVPLE